MDMGIQYWDELLVPLDNMITRDTATFVNSKAPDYLASVYEARARARARPVPPPCSSSAAEHAQHAAARVRCCHF